MRAHFGLPSVTGEETEGKPPIQVKFEIPYFTTSGIQVRRDKPTAHTRHAICGAFLTLRPPARLFTMAAIIDDVSVQTGTLLEDH